jgi:hypothetical protein
MPHARVKIYIVFNIIFPPLSKTSTTPRRFITMAPEEGKSKHVGLSQEELDILENKYAMIIAEDDEIVNGWMKASNRPPKPPIMTDEEIEAQISSYGLGTGGGTTTQNSVELGNKSLHARFLPSKTLKASKARDAEEKAASAKRGSRAESSDEEEGRSGLGKAKKHKQKSKVQEPIKPVTIEQEEKTPELNLSITESPKKFPTQDGNQLEEGRSGKSNKRKSKPVVEEPVKKAKLEEKSIVTEPEPTAEAEREDDTDIDMEEGSGSKKQKVDLAVTGESGSKEDRKKEAKRLKKKLKREKKRKLQAEAASLASKV